MKFAIISAGEGSRLSQEGVALPKPLVQLNGVAMIDRLIRPTRKPDFDNIGKVICDALNGIAYRDDAQIVDALVRKFYSDIPRVIVEISDIPYEQ